jgi:nucleoside-diphosphate-sugar epimerase
VTSAQTLVVTGASGFCGSHIAAAAHRAGYAVVCVGRRPGPVGVHVFWDASSGGAHALLAGLLPACSSPVAAVVHCAAAVGDLGPQEWFERVNVGGTAAVLETAAGLGSPAVVVSSGSVYDHRTPTPAIGEDHAQGGWVTAYGRTKAAADALALSAGARVLRPHAVYGPGDRYLLPRVTAAVRGGQLVLPGPDVPLSVTHVRTLTSAALAAPGWGVGAYNIADTDPVSRDWLLGSAASAALGSPVRVRHLPAAALRSVAGALEAMARRTEREPVLTRYAVDQLAHPFVLDIGKARAQGWTPPASVDEHLAWLTRARGRGEREG